MCGAGGGRRASQDRRTGRGPTTPVPTPMPGASTTAAHLDQLWDRYSRGPGLLLKVVECSMVPPWMWLHHGSSLPADARLLDEERCLRSEISRTTDPPPVSLLRWDLPDALFRGGRWLTDRHVGDVCGCQGHQISSTSIGLLLGPNVRVAGAFAHDVGTTQLRLRPSCSRRNTSRTQAAQYARRYARLRLDGLNGTSKYHNMIFHNMCMQRSVAQVAAHVRAFAQLQSQEGADNLGPRCLGPAALYNQVHASYGPASIAAIFYVNDTLTPTRHPDATRQEIHRLVEAAKCAAARACALAQRTALLIAELGAEVGRVPPPVVQYRFTDECTSSHSYLKRSSRSPPLRRPARWILTAPPPQVAYKQRHVCTHKRLPNVCLFVWSPSLEVWTPRATPPSTSSCRTPTLASALTRPPNPSLNPHPHPNPATATHPSPSLKPTGEGHMRPSHRRRAP